jgi:hypothetical protein
MIAGGQELSAYERSHTEDITPEFITLGELTLEAGPKGLRRLAKFFNQCAEHLENGGAQDHFHFNSNINTRPQIVVINKKAAKAWRRGKKAGR